MDPFLLKGIVKTTKTNERGGKVHTRNADKSGVKKESSHYVGDIANGQVKVHNGQWWPYLICAARDGAHGEIEAGISGTKGRGAFSIVLSHSGYADVDEGEEIKYCGTSGQAGKPSFGTSLLLEAQRKGNSIRVLRSHSLTKNEYAPKEGFRYDGLYDFVGFEELDRQTAMFRFTLRRVRGQEPIRYKGVERRPTEAQLKYHREIRRNEGLPVRGG